MKRNENGWDAFLDFMSNFTIWLALGIILFLAYHYNKKMERERDDKANIPNTVESVNECREVDDGFRECNDEHRIMGIGIVAETLWREARGEGENGIRAVASVIWNRSKETGLHPMLVCVKKKQFSCWNNENPFARDNMECTGEKATDGGFRIWTLCVDLARKIVDGQFQPTVSANHYYNPKKCRPSWGKKMKRVVTIGKHRFGRI